MAGTSTRFHFFYKLAGLKKNLIIRVSTVKIILERPEHQSALCEDVNTTLSVTKHHNTADETGWVR